MENSTNKMNYISILIFRESMIEATNTCTLFNNIKMCTAILHLLHFEDQLLILSPQKKKEKGDLL